MVGDRRAASKSMARRRRQPENRETDHSEWRSSPSARRKRGVEGRQPRPGDRANADTARNLLHRLDNVDACERQSERASDPLDRRRGPHHERPGDRRRMKRLAPEDRRELRPLKQVAKLGFRIGQALSVRRAVRARPNAPAGGHDHDHSSLRRGNAPQFFEQRVRPIGRLQARERATAGRWSRQAAATFAHRRAPRRNAPLPARSRRPVRRASRPGIGERRRGIGRDRARRNPPRRSRGRRCYPSAHGSRARSACGRRCRGASRRSSAS